MGKIKKILIVAGEASGDLHAANLVTAIKNILPETEFFGLGGKKLEQQGVTLYYNIVELAVVGIFEVLKNLTKFHKIFHNLLYEVDKNRPDLAILVDYPGFNLRLAEELKKKGIPVIYYISPQVWAWGEKRIKIIKNVVRHMIVIFHFEEALYKNEGIPVSFVGHPLLEAIRINTDREQFLKKFGLDHQKLTIALLPGSREKEVKTLLPIMLKSARLLKNKVKNTQFIILRSPAVEEKVFRDILKEYGLPVPLVSDMTYDGLNASDFAIVASGTATLETAILGVPMAIVYKVSFLTWAFVKAIIKIPYIGLINVVMQRKIVEEFIQFDATPKKISSYACGIITSKENTAQIKNELNKVKTSLGNNNASSEAAKIVAQYLNF